MIKQRLGHHLAVRLANPDVVRPSLSSWVSASVPYANTFHAAKLLIDQHGEEATIRAARRAEELLHDGNSFGSAIWRQVLEAIEALKSDPPT